MDVVPTVAPSLGSPRNGGPNGRRVVLVDDETVFRDLLAAFLSRFEGMRVEGSYGDGREALSGLRRKAVDVVVADLMLPGLGGADLCRQMLQLGVRNILVLTGRQDPGIFRELQELGVHGFVQKGLPLSTVAEAIRQVAEGSRFFCFPSLPADAALPEKALGSPLSPREREVVQLTAEGLSAKEVGLRLGISARTAEKHRENAMGKLGVKDVAGMVRRAIGLGLVSSTL